MLVGLDVSDDGTLTPPHELVGDPFFSTLPFTLSVPNELIGGSALLPGSSGKVINILSGNGSVPSGSWASTPDRLEGGYINLND